MSYLAGTDEELNRTFITICVIVTGIIFLLASPYFGTSFSLGTFKVNGYSSTVGLWDLYHPEYSQGATTYNKTTPPRNYFLPANGSQEDTFLKCGVGYGARAAYLSPANLGEVHLKVQTGTINLYIFDQNNSQRWKANQPYTTILEATNIGTANLTFPIPI